MPTYDYVCSHCGHQFEKFQKMSAEPIKVCPSCGQETVQRVIGGGAGILFKGSGFYVTDYRSDSYKSKAQSEGGASQGKQGSGQKDTGSQKSDNKSES
jgi:putative FmdB family regulatory protein